MWICFAVDDTSKIFVNYLRVFDLPYNLNDTFLIVAHVSQATDTRKPIGIPVLGVIHYLLENRLNYFVDYFIEILLFDAAEAASDVTLNISVIIWHFTRLGFENA